MNFAPPLTIHFPNPCMRSKFSRSWLWLLVIPCWLLVSVMNEAAAETPTFDIVELDPAICQVAVYGVLTTDVNNDGRTDIVAVTENRVVWFAGPEWQPQVILENQVERDHVCLAAHDIDGDGWIDFALGAGWTKIGTMYWISRSAPGERFGDQPAASATSAAKWHVYPIGREVWTHRMRWADVLGTGQPQLVVSPLNAVEAPGVRLLAFPLPTDPQAGPWQPEVIDEQLHRVHNHWHLDWDQDGDLETLAASQEGIQLIGRVAVTDFSRNALSVSSSFQRRQLATGATTLNPEQAGTGEVKPGRLRDGRTFLAAIEPMHGHIVAAYLPTTEKPGSAGEPPALSRVILDETFQQGHAVYAADLNGDGQDEIIAGHREASPHHPPGVFVFECVDLELNQWERTPLDVGGVAVEDLICTDVDADGWVDIVAGGRATRNLKLYRNRGLR
jgi:hypothetical protein